MLPNIVNSSIDNLSGYICDDAIQKTICFFVKEKKNTFVNGPQQIQRNQIKSIITVQIHM